MNKLKQNYNKVKDNILELSGGNKLNPEVKLIAVSKTFLAETISELYLLGQTEFAENYVQEFSAKAVALCNLNINWHFIGRIQSNKTQYIAKYATWVHGLDNIKHATRLNNDRPPDMQPLNVLIEVNLSGDETRHGLSTLQQIIELANLINNQKNLLFRGLMGIASATKNLELVEAEFQSLNQKFIEVQKLYGANIDTLSMGMSGDYPIAIKCGTTMVRIGSLIFGERDYN